MRIAITGASGFVGTYLVKALENEHEVVPICHKEVNLNNFDILLKKIKEINPDVIYHLAAQSSPYVSWKEPYKTLKDNILSSLNLLQISEQLDVKIILAGSAEVYDTDSLKFFDKLVENSFLRPRNPYGLSKLTLDYFVEMIVKERNLKVILLRLFNHIGPGQSENFVVSAFAKQLAEIKLGLKDPTIQVGNLEAKRDFIDISDVINAYIKVLDVDNYGEAFNICSGYSYKIEDILNTLIDISELDVTIKQDSKRMRPSDIPVFVGDYTKINKLVGWTPSVPIRRTLKNVYIDWIEKLKKENNL